MSNFNSFVEYRDRFSDMHAHGMTHIITYMRLEISFCLHGIYVFYYQHENLQLFTLIRNSSALVRYRDSIRCQWENFPTQHLYEFHFWCSVTSFYLLWSDRNRMHSIASVSFARYTHDYHWYIFLFILWLLPLNRIETPFFSRNSMHIRWMSWLNIVRQCSSFIIRAVYMIFIIFHFFACIFSAGAFVCERGCILFLRICESYSVLREFETIDGDECILIHTELQYFVFAYWMNIVLGCG